MTRFRAPAMGLVLSALTAGLAFAQPDTTGTGAGPLSTETAPNTTALGRTKPPSRDAGQPAVGSVTRPTPRQVADDAIATRICIGCGAEPGTTGSLPGAAPASGARETRDVRLHVLQGTAQPTAKPGPQAAVDSTPRPQSDLDTVPLASAHREQARSAEEKTNGLWQSWLVSVCEGCGDQKPARALKLEDWPDRTAGVTPGPAERRPARVRAAAAKSPETRPGRSLEANLAPENLTAIRRMPQE